MENISIGKIRGLQEISTVDGFLTVLALDQRGSLIRAMGLDKEDPKLYESIRDFKMDTVRELLPFCSAVLLDPQYSAAEAIHDGLISGQKGINYQVMGTVADCKAGMTEIFNRKHFSSLNLWYIRIFANYNSIN